MFFQPQLEDLLNPEMVVAAFYLNRLANYSVANLCQSFDGRGI